MGDVVVPIITGITGLASGLILASWRAGLGLATRYDVDLREKRLQAYNELWSSLKGLDLRARPKSMTIAEAEALLTQLTTWYHETGGLLMSRATQRRFAALQRHLVVASEKSAEGAAALDATTLSLLLNSASALRTSTTGDVLSRLGPILGITQRARR